MHTKARCFTLKALAIVWDNCPISVETLFALRKSTKPKPKQTAPRTNLFLSPTEWLLKFHPLFKMDWRQALGNLLMLT
jgi:hypothetical protein